MNADTQTTVEDLKVSVAVMKEQINTLIRESQETRHAVKNAQMSNDTIARSLISIENKLEKYNDFMTSSTPTITEFNQLKLKAEGAGILGKWLWFLAGFTISGVAAIFTLARQYWP